MSCNDIPKSKSLANILEVTFLHGNLLPTAVWSRKNPWSNHLIHMLFEHGFYLTKPKLGFNLFAWRCTGKCCGIDWSFPQCFCSQECCACLWRCGNVMTFDADAILFREIQCKKRNIFNVLAMFSDRFKLKSGKICRNSDHTCLFHCINTCQIPRTMFEHSA